jgi:hypothetical protein
MKKNLILIVPALAVLFLFSGCEKEEQRALRGSWILESINYTYKNTGNFIYDVEKDGTMAEKQSLITAVQNLSPLVFTFTDKALIIYHNKEVVGYDELEIYVNDFNIKEKEDYVAEYIVNDEKLTLTLKNWYYVMFRNQLPQIEQVSDLNLILKMKRKAVK